MTGKKWAKLAENEENWVHKDFKKMKVEPRRRYWKRRLTPEMRNYGS